MLGEQKSTPEYSRVKVDGTVPPWWFSLVIPRLLLWLFWVGGFVSVWQVVDYPV